MHDVVAAIDSYQLSAFRFKFFDDFFTIYDNNNVLILIYRQSNKGDVMHYDSCRDPLVVWCYQVHDVDRGRHIDLRILIDGHNRYEICTRLDIPFDVKEIDFDSRDEAKLWIVQNQLGRRNLTDFAKAERH
jgi:hypothetical protein